MGAVSVSFLALAGFTLLALHRIGLIIYRLYFRPLSKYPGHKYLVFSGLPKLYRESLRGEFYEEIRDLHGKYGNIVRIAPNEVSIDGSIGWNDVFGHKRGNEQEFVKDVLYYRPADGGEGVNGSGVQDILLADKENRRRQRRLIAHAFPDSALSEQEDLIKTYIDLLMQRFKEHVARDQVMDAVNYFNFATFDIIGDLTFGDSFHCLEDDKMHPCVALTVVSQLRIFAEYPYLRPLIRLCMTAESEAKIKENMAYTAAKLEKRLALGKNSSRKDFLSYILNHNNEKGMDYHEIMGNSEAFVMAGSETTATLLSGLTYSLSRNSVARKRLTDEVRDHFSSEDEITMRSAAAGLPYLHACLEEGLRIYPPAATTPPRISPGALVNGEYIHLVYTSTNGRLITETPTSSSDPFIPERWLHSSFSFYEPRFANDNRAAAQPFSHGPRNCIGKNLAYAEMRLIVSRIALNFELELMPESEDWLGSQRVFTLWQKAPLMMKFHLSNDLEKNNLM